VALRRRGPVSRYSEGTENQNYLRGVQGADADGLVRFTSIFPGCYAGRWPLIHFEIYPSLAEATASGTIAKTSQLALPQDVCETVYDGDEYGNSLANLAGSPSTATWSPATATSSRWPRSRGPRRRATPQA
jgi:protocatechuate 3,4-dioxygenase beta subunit